MESEKRLDVLLVELGLCDSRTRAQSAIESGRVSVDGKAVTKPSARVCPGQRIELTPEKEYVGRGAYKLLAALEAFSCRAEGRICLDVGASTGGFTQVWLEHGASHVFAVDVGRAQLAPVLAADSRVTDLEKTDVRTLSPSVTAGAALCSIDVSFISLTKILDAPAVKAVSDGGGEVIALVKPQFEAGKSALDKHGVVKKPSDHIRALESVIAFARSCGYRISGLIPSPISGGDGNREYLLYLGQTDSPVSAEKTVFGAFSRK